MLLVAFFLFGLAVLFLFLLKQESGFESLVALFLRMSPVIALTPEVGEEGTPVISPGHYGAFQPRPGAVGIPSFI